MEGLLITASGEERALPPLLAWEITRTNSGSPADAWQVRFAADAGTEALLRDGTRVVLRDADTVKMAGMVDEAAVRLDEDGCIAELNGRGMAALLLDNEALPASYTRAQLEDVLRSCAEPFGVELEAAVPMGGVPGYTIPAGTSCYGAVAGFARWAAGLTPRFTAEGKLVVLPEGSGAETDLTEACGQLLAAEWTRKEYGIIGQVVQVDSKSGARTLIEAGEGRGCRRVCTVNNGTWNRADSWPPELLMRQSRAEQELLELTLPGSAPVQPDDAAVVTIPALGVAGRFLVVQTISRGSAAGVTCQLTLRAWN